jgi:hypothetical protein
MVGDRLERTQLGVSYLHAAYACCMGDSKAAADYTHNGFRSTFRVDKVPDMRKPAPGCEIIHFHCFTILEKVAGRLHDRKLHLSG